MVTRKTEVDNIKLLLVSSTWCSGHLPDNELASVKGRFFFTQNSDQTPVTSVKEFQGML